MKTDPEVDIIPQSAPIAAPEIHAVPQEDHWLPGFNFQRRGMGREGADLRDAGDLPHARSGAQARDARSM
jgi:hypothetical protein